MDYGRPRNESLILSLQLQVSRYYAQEGHIFISVHEGIIMFIISVSQPAQNPESWWSLEFYCLMSMSIQNREGILQILLWKKSWWWSFYTCISRQIIIMYSIMWEKPSAQQSTYNITGN